MYPQISEESRTILNTFAKNKIMEVKLAPHNIYAESTPNPSTMKFVSNRYLIVDGEVYEFNNKQEAEVSDLATELFTFPFITGVFIASNFISISKSTLVEWDDILIELKAFIGDFLNAEGAKIIDKTKLQEAKASSDTSSENSEKRNIQSPRKEDLSPIELKITEILDEYVRPAVESDGGAIHFHEFKDGVVSVVLKGACSGCPSSTMTLKTGIQNLLMDMLPEVKQVEAING
jgi:Fe-S cluster biogenesis protein NfuA